MTAPKKIVDMFHDMAIRREMALYAETRRPIHAWRAYHWIRHAGLPPPPWFLEYLDGCAARLTESPLDTPEQVAMALDLGAKGRHRTECRRLEAVEMACALKQNRKPGERNEDIYRKVAKQLGVQWTYVRNACQDWLTKN
jgi:hypothetical protein